MTIRMMRGDAPAIAQVTRVRQPEGPGELLLTIPGSGKSLTFPAWNVAAIVAAWNASTWPEFAEARASASGNDLLLTSKQAGRPFYLSATLGGSAYGNEVQVLVPINVTGGLAVAHWLGQSTATFDPTAVDGAALKDLFEALPGGIVATDELSWSGPVGGPWQVTFGGRYAEQSVPQIQIDSSDLTGGVTGLNELQRLLGGDAVTGTTFNLRRPDTLQTTATLTIPVTSSQVQTALTAIDYETTCTGGPVTASDGPTDVEEFTRMGTYDDTGLVNDSDVSGLVFVFSIGQDAGSNRVVLMQFPLAVAQGTTIGSALLTINMKAGGGELAGIKVRAWAADDANWPANRDVAVAAPRTTAFATFDSHGLGGIIKVDVTDVLQEILDRPGFASGNDIVFFFEAPPSVTYALVSLKAHANSLAVYASAAPITIEWTGGDAQTDIPLLIVVPSGGYAGPPVIIPIQDGRIASAAALVVSTTHSGGEAVVVRDDVRSRGPNHYDDPLNWESDDGTFSVPEDGDLLFVESGKVDLLYGLKQRSEFVTISTLNLLRLTEIHHLWVGQAVRVVSTGTLPGGLAAATRYYVVSVDGPYVQLSATRGGAPVTLTDAGTGIHTLGVRLISAEIQARWSGKLGLPRLNTASGTYWEYRERFLEIWCDSIKLGTGVGSGSNRQNISTGVFATTLQAVTSGGSIETGVNAVLWKGDNEDNQVETLTADLGVAIFPEETASFDKLIQRGGTSTLGRGVTGNTIDKTGGSMTKLGCVIGGQAFES